MVTVAVAGSVRYEDLYLRARDLAALIRKSGLHRSAHAGPNRSSINPACMHLF
jgi:hypothetical protein